MAGKRPLFTVVTVTYNAASVLEGTVASVLSQDLADREYVIIDGGSTDGTLEIIRRHQEELSFWCSEPDRGIYDAMNKGAAVARGEWIIFLNAGDTFCGEDALSRVAPYAPSADLIYGDCRVAYPDGAQRLRRAGNPDALWRGMPFCHQSLAARTELLRRHPFDLRRSLCADFDFVYRAFLRGERFAACGSAISTISAGGVSDRRRQQVWREYAAIVRSGSRNPWHGAYFRARMVQEGVKSLLKLCLPGRMVNLFRNG